MWNDITVDVINVECDPEESNQGGIEPAPYNLIEGSISFRMVSWKIFSDKGKVV